METFVNEIKDKLHKLRFNFVVNSIIYHNHSSHNETIFPDFVLYYCITVLLKSDY